MNNYIFTLQKRIYIYTHTHTHICIQLHRHFNETQFVGQWVIGGKYRMFHDFRA